MFARTVVLLAGIVVAVPSSANLMLSTSINSSFGMSSMSTGGNDLPNAPSQVYFGQLLATQSGIVDFFYIGNEAGYTNSFTVEGDTAVSVGPDTFTGPYSVVDSLIVTAGQLLDFGFCTNGGDLVADAGRCANNNDADSLVNQFDYPINDYGYRSIGYAALAGFDSTTTGGWTYANPLDGPTSNLWMILWDDSGARNDDNHDDLAIVARYRSVSVPEPGTLMLLGAGLLAIGAFSVSRRRAMTPA